MTQLMTSDDSALWAAYQLFTASIATHLAETLRTHDLSEADFAVLKTLTEQQDGTVRVKDLARSSAWESSRLAHQLRRLEKRNLIFRMPCPTDARGTVVLLSAQGRELLANAIPDYEDAVQQHFVNALQDDEKTLLHTILRNALSRHTATPTHIDITDAALQANTQRPDHHSGSSSDVQRINTTTHGDSHRHISMP